MKQITCEMCGSKDLVKQDGLFVCQSCGVKYSIEEARKLLVEIEGTVEVTGTVKVDRGNEIDNLLLRAMQFETVGDIDKALQYYNKILDIDISNEIAKNAVLRLDSFYIGDIKVSPSSIQEIDSYMKEGNTLNAIKTVRIITGWGLADAKAWIENYPEYKRKHNIK